MVVWGESDGWIKGNRPYGIRAMGWQGGVGVWIGKHREEARPPRDTFLLWKNGVWT